MMNLHLRKVRIYIFSLRLWRKRLVFWSGAVLVGLAASFYALAADEAKLVFDLWNGAYPLLALVISPLVFALCAWSVQMFFPAARGSGIPQVIAARILRNKKERNEILSLRVAAGKVLITIVGLLGGAAIGREANRADWSSHHAVLCISRWFKCAAWRGIGRGCGGRGCSF